MHPMLEQYFEKKQNEEKKEREALLISEGLYETGEDSNNPVKVPLQVSDEEYERIKGYASKKTVDRKESIIASWLKIFSICIFVFGSIGGMVMAASQPQDSMYTIAITLFIWVESAVIGSLLLGISEIIRLLNR